MVEIKIKTEQLIALSALVVSLCALLVSGWQAMLSRSHNRLSVMPKLELRITSHINEDFPVNIKLVNVGLGPAKIYDFRYKLGETYSGNMNVQSCVALFEWLDDGTIGDRIDHCHILDANHGLYLRPLENFVLFRTKVEAAKTISDSVQLEKISLVSAEVHYCSIYNQCVTENL